MMNARKIAWHKAKDNEWTTRIRCILQKWLPYADLQYKVWDGRPSCGHFFGGAYWYGLETAYTASVYALLAKFPEYEEKVTGIPREEVLRKAISAIRYLGFTHDSGPADCVRAEGRNKFCSLTKWGGRGQKFFPASQTGVTIASFALSAWLLWEDLDEETQQLVQNVLVEYADRWSEEEPRNGAYHDTQTEENAWTAGGIAAALALFPEHPHHENWQIGFEAWTMNSITLPSDRHIDPKVIKTTTFHPDYTTENHGFAHPGYICAGINLRGIHAVFCFMGDVPISESLLRNSKELYDRTIKVWSQFDGLAVPVQGQDWWYCRQHERQLTHALINVLHQDSDAANFERNSLTVIEGIQNSNSLGCLLEENGEQCIISGYQTAKDMEHTSAKDLVISCLLHLFGGPGVNPSDSEELNSRLQGVYRYPFGGTVIHRTKDSFSSFSWRNRVMGLTLPAKGCWTVTPLPSSLTGTVEQERYVVQAEKENIRLYENGFGATVSLYRGQKELRQNVAYISLPDGTTVYIEQTDVLKACTFSEMNTGMIGVRNENYGALPELAKGFRRIITPNSIVDFEGFYGRQANAVSDFTGTNWVQIDDEIGYVLIGSEGIRYINQHEYSKWKGVEDILILNRRGEMKFESPASLKPFVAVSLPNRLLEETKSVASQTQQLTTDEAGLILLEVEGRLVYSNFHDTARSITARREQHSKHVQLYEGINVIDGGNYCWKGKIDAFSSGFYESEWIVEVAGKEAVTLEMTVFLDRLFITNQGKVEKQVCVKHNDGSQQTIQAVPGSTIQLQKDRF